MFKGMFAPLIRDTFNLGLRNDGIDQATNHQTAGWKGLRAVQVQEMAEKAVVMGRVSALEGGRARSGWIAANGGVRQYLDASV